MSLNVELLRSSFALVLERAPNVTHRFYDHLFERHPDLRPLFGKNSRGKQEEMLAQALVAVVDHLEDAPWLESTLKALGRKHVDYGVTDAMYDQVGDALLVTLGEVAAEAWTPELKQAWTDAYGAIAGLMQEGARGAATAAE
jgi:hemoglobin-like flavoprotein